MNTEELGKVIEINPNATGSLTLNTTDGLLQIKSDELCSLTRRNLTAGVLLQKKAILTRTDDGWKASKLLAEQQDKGLLYA